MSELELAGNAKEKAEANAQLEERLNLGQMLWPVKQARALARAWVWANNIFLFKIQRMKTLISTRHEAFPSPYNDSPHRQFDPNNDRNFESRINRIEFNL